MLEQLADPTLPESLTLTGTVLAQAIALRGLVAALVPHHTWYCRSFPFLCPHR